MTSINIDSRFWRRPDSLWMKSILDSAYAGVLVESEGEVVYVNSRYAQLLGYRHSDELIGRSVEELIGSADSSRLVEFGRRRARGEQAPSRYDFVARHRNGTEVRLQATVSVAIVENRRCITTFVQPFYDSMPAAPEMTGEIEGSHRTLSERERQVMDLIVSGRRIKEIAFDLALSEKTVATHRARMLRKMGLSDNRELFQYALRHRLVDWS